MTINKVIAFVATRADTSIRVDTLAEVRSGNTGSSFVEDKSLRALETNLVVPVP